MEGREIDAAIAEIYRVVQQVWNEDLAAGRVQQRKTAVVPDSEFEFHVVREVDALDHETWASGLDRADMRLRGLEEHAHALSEASTREPYGQSDGWEFVRSVALAAHSYDFLSATPFSLETIQHHTRKIVLEDRMIERTIYPVFGLKLAEKLKLGERSWLVLPNRDRRSHVAKAIEFSSPLVSAHCYLVSDCSAPSSDVREGKTDALPSRLQDSLRAVCRADLKTFAPWVESLIILPARYAGFTRLLRQPPALASYSVPNADVDMTAAKAEEVVQLHNLLSGEPPKDLKGNVRSLRLALSRLSIASGRSELPDSFLDLMIALEALLSRDGEKSEITYRIALRGAWASPQTPAHERSAIRAALADAYNTRSQIVHGSKDEPRITEQSLQMMRNLVALLTRLTAFGIAARSPLVNAIETALLGDASSLQALQARLD